PPEDLLRLISSLPTSSLPSSPSSLIAAQSQLLLWNALLTSFQGASSSSSFSDLEEGEIRVLRPSTQPIAPPSSSSSSSDPKPRRPPVTDESIVRIPLDHAWKRHTFIREMTAFGIKGVVVYFSPCGKRLGSFSEVVRYLTKHDTVLVNREQFTFSPKVIVGEFFVGVPKNGQLVNVKFSEEDVKSELKRLQDERMKKIEEEKEKRDEKRKEIVKKEREDKLLKKKEEGVEEKEENGEPKRRAVEDLTLEEIRPLPPFKRIEGLELSGEAFGDLLMTVQFMQNFKKTLEFDCVPSVESLSRGCMGALSSPLLPSLHSLLSRCLTHLSSPRKTTLNGRSLAEIPVNEGNRDELLRIFLAQSDGEGPKFSHLLDSSSFLSLSPDKKASILGTLVNQLLCSTAVTSQLDGHLDEVTKLKGERWMKEGKIRALRNHQNRRRKRKNGEEETEIERRSESPERSIKFTPGIGQCEVLSPEEEALDDAGIDAAVAELGVKSDDLTSSINALNSRVRVFPIGEDRYHRLYWSLPSLLPTLIESIESGHKNNPSCDLSVCDSDPPSIHIDSFIDPEVVGCLEDLIDRLVEGGGGEGKKKKLGFRKMSNPEKRGWWTVTSRDVDQWKANLHQRGLRERVLHRSIVRNDLIDDLPLGDISIGRVGEIVDEETVDSEMRNDLSKKLLDLQYILMKEKIIDRSTVKESTVSIEGLKGKILSIQAEIRNDRFNLLLEEKEEEDVKEEGNDLLDQWKTMTEKATTTSQLVLSTQLLCSLVSFSSSWQCSLCFFPSSSSPFLLCSSCSQSKSHPHCVSSSSNRKEFKCLQCLPKINLVEDEDEIIEVNDEDKKCGLPSKGATKRRAEPNSFVVPPSMVNGLGRSMLDEMEEMEGVEFFTSPVDLDEVPSYAVLIDKPMDLGTISQRVDQGWYHDTEDFLADVTLVFTNCRNFNEDDSEIGEAGIRINRFFVKRWRQLKYNLSKRVKRMKSDI
ncbi:hypothetical protein PFISCL1PPCAC_10328, partial [Pristionchus fissidentatus]